MLNSYNHNETGGNKVIDNRKDIADVAVATSQFWLDNNHISSKTEDEIMHYKVRINAKYLETYEFKTGIERKKVNKGIKIFNPDNIRKGNKRAVADLKSIIRANFDGYRHCKFVTVTFDPKKCKFNLFDLKTCLRKHQTFIKKLNKIYPSFKWVCVPEKHPKSARYHFHYLMLIPYIRHDDMAKIWGYGEQVKVVKADNKSKNYMVKEFVKQMTSYMCKTVKYRQDKGSRRYYCSNSVTRPETFYGNDAVKITDYCKNYVLEKIEEREYYVDFVGYVVYRAYKLRKRITPQIMDRVVYYYSGT